MNCKIKQCAEGTKIKLKLELKKNDTGQKGLKAVKLARRAEKLLKICQKGLKAVKLARRAEKLLKICQKGLKAVKISNINKTKIRKITEGRRGKGEHEEK